MPNDPTPSGLPPSGPWTGYYIYFHSPVKHRMRLRLIFTPDGKIEGEGIDDVAPFAISGIFDCDTRQAIWAKSYIGMHRVEYSGVYDQRAIAGNWTLRINTGGF